MLPVTAFLTRNDSLLMPCPDEGPRWDRDRPGVATSHPTKEQTMRTRMLIAALGIAAAVGLARGGAALARATTPAALQGCG